MDVAGKPRAAWSRLNEGERERLLDLVSTLLLSCAVVLTAFSAWESTLWNGEQSEAYARASSARGQANAALTTAGAQIAYDHTSFSLGVVEFFRSDVGFVDFFRSRLARDEFRPALEQWLALAPLQNTNAPRTPFEMPEYTNAALESSKVLAAESQSELAVGDEANEHGDNYVLATVFLAAVLFFTGVVTKFKSDGIRFFSLSMASVALIGTTAFLLTLPRIFTS